MVALHYNAYYAASHIIIISQSHDNDLHISYYTTLTLGQTHTHTKVHKLINHLVEPVILSSAPASGHTLEE